RALHPEINGIVRDARLRREARRALELELAMKLPEAIKQDAASMLQVIVTFWLPLRPVAQIMLVHEAERSGHTYENAGIYHQVFQPERAIEAVVNEAAMHAHGMARTKRNSAQHDERPECAPVE